MRTKHQKTLDLIFEDPVRPDILWSEIETLFMALDGEVTEGRGARVRVHLSDVRAVFHRPQPPSHKATAGQALEKRQVGVL